MYCISYTCNAYILQNPSRPQRITTTGDHSGRTDRETPARDHKWSPQRETTAGDHNVRPQWEMTARDTNGRPQREITTGDRSWKTRLHQIKRTSRPDLTHFGLRGPVIYVAWRFVISELMDLPHSEASTTMSVHLFNFISCIHVTPGLSMFVASGFILSVYHQGLYWPVLKQD